MHTNRSTSPMGVIGPTRQMHAGHDRPVPELNSTEHRYLTEAELAARWRISVKTLQRWRTIGSRPAFSKFFRSVRYPLDGLNGVLEMEQIAMPPAASGHRG